MAIFAKEQPPSQLAPRPGQEPSQHLSVLGKNVVFDGALTGNENVLIEGTVKGTVDLGSDLRIGPTARVEATVHAANVLIEGALVGDVSADRKVELVASARVDGNIKAPKIVVAEGARFRGAVDMGSEKPA